MAIGRAYLENIARELNENLAGDFTRIETMVTIASDWPNAVLVQASRLKVQMLLTAVSERSLAHKVLRGDDTERLLLQSPCDVGIYRGP
jgi:nucleotide-binding universal stress UspA family protein